MAALSTNEKQVLEQLFQMRSGYVLNFSDRTFGEFFRDDVGVNIFDQAYNYASGSKANRLRGFWQAAIDPVVGNSIDALLEYVDGQILLGQLRREEFPQELIERGRKIAARLRRGDSEYKAEHITEAKFISENFGDAAIDKMGLDLAICAILQQRVDEIRRALIAGAPLAVIFLCGSTLEGVLLAVARGKTKEFNQAAGSPKDKSGKVKPLNEWTLNDLINVARELNLVGEDVKKFSHALRDFRNYIHPYQQMSSDFHPDEYTAKICWQVLQAAITQLSK